MLLSKREPLIVDEFGYLPLKPDPAHLFFQLVSRRYETGAMLHVQPQRCRMGHSIRDCDPRPALAP